MRMSYFVNVEGSGDILLEVVGGLWSCLKLLGILKSCTTRVYQAQEVTLIFWSLASQLCENYLEY